jgi:hypothetical protein
MATPQHLTQFLSLVAVDALFGVFSGGEGLPGWRRGLLWLAATAGVVAQLTSAFYLGWFLVLSLGFAAAFALWLPSTRGRFLAVLWRDAPWVVVSAVAGGLVLRAWAARHLAAEFGARFLTYVWVFLPRPETWLNMGPQSWFESWTTSLVHFPRPFTEIEQRLGLGLVTTAACLWGLAARRGRPSVRLFALVAVALFLSLTILPPVLVFATAYALILGPMALAFLGRRERPGVFAVAVGLMTACVFLDMRARDGLTGCGLFALGLTTAAFVGGTGGRGGRVVLGVLGACLGATLFPSPLLLALAALFGGLLAAAAALLGWRTRPRVEAVALAGALIFAAPVTYEGRPLVLVVAALAPLSLVVMKTVTGAWRPPPGALPHAMVVGLIAARVFGTDGTAWLFYYVHVPGASALLFASRVGLMMLIPGAIGLGLAIDVLLARKHPVAALALAAVCLAEQGVWTPSYDKLESRRVVSSLAGAVDPRADAFYSSPVRSPAPTHHANLDAMWAGLECGKPTVNGYSGGTPLGWRPIEYCKIDEPFDELWIGARLARWRAGYGRSVRRVEWLLGRFGWDLDLLLDLDRAEGRPG